MKTIIFVLILFIHTVAFAAVSVPITISESKPTDVNGIARSNEPVSFGFPLKDSDNIATVNTLGITGASMGQFRVLNNYPSGNIQWVLVDTIGSVDAGGDAEITITSAGSGNFGGDNLASESGNIITIATGSASFEVKKTNFNFIDKLTIGAVTVIDTGDSDGVIISDGTTQYYSKFDSSSSTSIEENGPVRVCIKSEGQLKNSDGDSYLKYTVRMHFFKNKTYMKSFITVRNASDDVTKVSKAIGQFGVSVKLNTANELSYVLARESAEITGTVSENVWLLQGYVTDFNILDNSDTYTNVTTNTGLSINGSSYAGEWTQGYLSAYNASDSIYCNAAMKFMGGYWPAGFEIQTDSDVLVLSFSDRNNIDPQLMYGTHQTREIIFDFNTSSLNADLTLYRIQYPLNGIAPLSQYKDSGAVFGNSYLLSVAEQNAYITSNSFTAMSISENVADMNILRRKNWSGTGGFQNDLYEPDILNYLRTGNGVLFNRAYAAALMKADTAILKSDGFTYNNPSATNTNTYSQLYDWAHAFWESLPMAYYLTGNELIKESLVDLFEWLDVESKETSFRFYYSPLDGSGDFRNSSRMLELSALLAEFFGASTQKNYLKDVIKKYIIHEDRDKDRGFFNANCDGTTDGAYYNLRDFMVTRIHMPAIYQAYRVLNLFNEQDISEDLEDILLGWSYFYMNEFIDSSYAVNTGYSTYEYHIPTENEQENTRFGDVNWCLPHSYLITGDTQFFNKRASINGVVAARGNTDYASGDVQAFIYQDVNRAAPTVGYISAVGSGRIDMGNDISSADISRDAAAYTLSFLTPANGITKYQIKVSNKPLVENLGFNQINRTYQYNPNTYNNFWAAMNVKDETTPKTSQGQSEAIVVDVSSLISAHNTTYGLTSGDAGFLEYDSETDYYFAIKYFATGQQQTQKSLSGGSMPGGNLR